MFPRSIVFLENLSPYFLSFRYFIMFFRVIRSRCKDEIFYSILTHLDPETFAASAQVCQHWNILSQNVASLQERRANKIILTDRSDIKAVQELLANLLTESKSLCHPWHTCLVESSHNQCTSFGEKRVNFYKSYEGRTFASYCKFNLGMMWIDKFYSKLGIPVSKSLKDYLMKLDEKSRFHRERQQSIEYKLRAKMLAVKKKKDNQAREKTSKKKRHDYSTVKELDYSKDDRPMKKRKANCIEEEDRVFGKFATIHHFGIVLHVDPDPNITHPYMVRFIDGETHDLQSSDLVPVDKLGEDKKIWVPNSINRWSITRDAFEKYYDRFDQQLESDFECYENGLLFPVEDEDSSDSDEGSDEDSTVSDEDYH